MPSPPLYGLDLVTNASGPTIDATSDEIVRVGLSTPGGIEVYDGDEAELIELVDRRLAMFDPGVIVTWQGSLLDLPLFELRASALGLRCGLRLRADHRASPASVIIGIEHSFCAQWHDHAHLELRRVYAQETQWWHTLFKRLDPETMIPPANALAARDPGRDADLARCLAERRWPRARKSIDRMPRPSGSLRRRAEHENNPEAGPVASPGS